jgi:hypothetical protein
MPYAGSLAPSDIFENGTLVTACSRCNTVERHPVAILIKRLGPRYTVPMLLYPACYEKIILWRSRKSPPINGRRRVTANPVDGLDHRYRGWKSDFCLRAEALAPAPVRRSARQRCRRFPAIPADVRARRYLPARGGHPTALTLH